MAADDGGDRPFLSVVVPAHNEGPGIAWAVGALHEELLRLVDVGRLAGGEVVVVDDHSTDHTAAAVAEVARTVSTGPVAVRTVAATAGRGLGAAIRCGLAAATGDLVAYTDADLPFDPEDLQRLLRAGDRYQADVVCGYRLDRTVEGTRRAIQSHAYNTLVRALLPVHVRDVNFACKLFRRPVVDVLLAELVSDGPFIDVEILARCARHHFRVVQVGVDYFPRFDTASTLGGPGAIRDILRELRAQRRELRARR